MFDALGAADELNSQIGLACEYCSSLDPLLEEWLREIQMRLLDAGSAIATPRLSSKAAALERVRFDPDDGESAGEQTPSSESSVSSKTATKKKKKPTSRSAKLVETWIDKMEEDLPPLRDFILPSGGLAASHLHIARTLTRRAERRVVPLVEAGELEPAVGVYFNRLSDFFFVAARYAAMKEGRPEFVTRKIGGQSRRVELARNLSGDS